MFWALHTKVTGSCYTSSFKIMFLKLLKFEMKVSTSKFRLPWWLSGREPTHQCRRRRFDPWSERSPGGEHGNLLQYACLENPKDRGVWQVTVHGGHKEWDMTEWLSTSTSRFCAPQVTHTCRSVTTFCPPGSASHTQLHQRQTQEQSLHFHCLLSAVHYETVS